MIVYELAHPWYGNSVSVHTWENIWLNEGFASYSEWLWSGHTHQENPQQIFDFLYADNPGGRTAGRRDRVDAGTHRAGRRGVRATAR